jgi:hypothetical protein
VTGSPIATGSRFATAYTDLPAGPCGGDPLEVIALHLLSLPATSTVDTDGDLLSDGFECAFFGGLGTGPQDDPDGDGVSTLQELLDGTDPMDKLSQGPVVADLSPAALDLILSGGGGVTLQFPFPAA